MKVSGALSHALVMTAGVGWITAASLIPTQGTKPKKPAPFEKVQFSRDVLPILSDKCFLCHGPDSTSRQAGLRLDTPTGAFADRGGRYAIVPGRPDHSLILKRIHDKNMPMPPADSGKVLTAKEKQIIRTWIAQGAEYSKLWSFEALPKTVPEPKVQSTWVRDDIDRFVLATLQKEKLTPSAPASRERWLRRVTFDLTGLPPQPSEVAAFTKDPSPKAYEAVVDRLLASSHFGERMAVDWLDAARYADSYGYQSDLLMPAWPYRDWVIRAFNSNKPYDQFLVEQLAGDLLPNATRDQRLATAYNRLHRQSNEGGSIPLEYKTEYAVDRVSTYGTSMLGLTLGCARCHDHKFDPISQKEFFQLYAYFNSIDEFGLLLSTEIVPTPSLLLPNKDQETMLAKLRKASDEAIAKRALAHKEAATRYSAWKASKPSFKEIPDLLLDTSLDSAKDGKYPNPLSDKVFASPIGSPVVVDGKSGKGLLLDGDNGIVLRGLPSRERHESFTWGFWMKDSGSTKKPMLVLHRTGGTDVGFCGFDLTLEDGYLTARVMRQAPGNSITIKTKSRITPKVWTHVSWSWDGSGQAAGARLYLDGKLAPTEVLNAKLWKGINAYGDLGPSGGDWSFGQRFRDLGFKGGQLDEVAFAARALSGFEVAMLAGTAPAAPSDAALLEYYTSAFDAPSREAQTRVSAAQLALLNHENGIYEISIMEEASRKVPAYLLNRGEYDAPRTEKNRVVRGVPKALPPLAAQLKNDRLALAKWTVDPSHPLTARVAVNRIWQSFFGTGLVETSDNFGTQGSRPSHPELLDSLSRSFVNSGWNVKALVRRIVLSATYRQDSRLTPKLKQVDPQNRLLARGPSGKLSAEMIRDAVLSASGLLTDELGGAPVNPYQPPGIWSENNTMSPGFVQSKGKDLYRRSIYSTIKRTTPVPSMLLFDATSREACTIRRPSTNTPLQALVLLNDVQFVEAARVLAERVMTTQSSDDSRIREAFRRLASRDADSRELTILSQTLQEQRKVFAERPGDAAKLIAMGETKAAATMDADELASMTVVVQTILNSDAVIWKR